MPTATLTSQLDRGVGVGIRHLIHSLSPSTSAGQVGGSSPPRAGRMETPDDPLSGGAPGLSITPRSPFLGKCISYSVCNVDPSPGVWGRRWVRWGGGWPSVPPGGAGGNCIETSLPRQTGVGLPVPSQPSTCTLWGRERCCDGPRDTPENRSATCPCPLAMPRVSHHLLLPLSPPCPPPPSLRGACLPAWKQQHQGGKPGQHPGGGDEGDSGERWPCWASCPVGPGHGHQAALTWSWWRWRRAPALPEQQ